MNLGELPRKVHLAVAAAVALGFFVFMAVAISGVDAWSEGNDGSAEDFTTLTDALFSDHVLALEVLGILLTAAMIGAMIIARPMGSVDDSVNYPTKISGASLSHLQHVSDVERNMSPSTFDTVDIGGEEE